MEAEVSKIFEPREEGCHANSKVMPLEHIGNMSGQRCDMTELWNTTFYHVHVLLADLIRIKRNKQRQTG
jgi:hypothetical protein